MAQNVCPFDHLLSTLRCLKLKLRELTSDHDGNSAGIFLLENKCHIGMFLKPNSWKSFGRLQGHLQNDTEKSIKDATFANNISYIFQWYR